jgi:hypothetical protein
MAENFAVARLAVALLRPMSVFDADRNKDRNRYDIDIIFVTIKLLSAQHKVKCILVTRSPTTEGV